MLLISSAIAAASAPPTSAQQAQVPADTTLAMLQTEGLENSQLMETLSWLTDVSYKALGALRPGVDERPGLGGRAESAMILMNVEPWTGADTTLVMLGAHAGRAPGRLSRTPPAPRTTQPTSPS